MWLYWSVWNTHASRSVTLMTPKSLMRYALYWSWLDNLNQTYAVTRQHDSKAMSHKGDEQNISPKRQNR